MKIRCCPPLHTRTRVSFKSRFEDFKEVFQCDTCNESYPVLAELEEHRQTDHHELISYNCKLCNEKFESPEFHSMHRNYKGHQELSESVDEQFMLQKGNICEECYFWILKKLSISVKIENILKYSKPSGPIDNVAVYLSTDMKIFSTIKRPRSMLDHIYTG